MSESHAGAGVNRPGTDRIGRANLIVYGALVAGLIAYFGVPSAHTRWEFAVWYRVMTARQPSYARLAIPLVFW